MKAKVLAALKTKFDGVQDAILSRVADKLISSGKVKKEEDITTAVAGVTFQQVLDYYGDSRADEASTSAVRNYENKHNIKDGKPIEAPADTSTQGKKSAANVNNGGGDEKVPSWAAELIASNKAMTDRLNAIEKGRTTESRRSQLDAVISKLPENIRKAYARTPIESQSDDEFTSLLADVTNEVAEIEKSTRAAGAVTGRPLGTGRAAASSQGAQTGNASEATDAEVDAVVAKLNI